jgi:hypothetical protein
MDVSACTAFAAAALSATGPLHRHRRWLDIRIGAPSSQCATIIGAGQDNDQVHLRGAAPVVEDHTTAAAAPACARPALPTVYVQCVPAAGATSDLDGAVAAAPETATAGPGAAPHGGGRGCFTHPPSAVTIFANRVATGSDVAQLLAHELTHAADYLVHRMDLATCGELACSELRAASAAECADVRPAGARRRCVRDTAWISTDMVFRGVGGQCVDAVMPWCADSDPGANPAAPGMPLHAALGAERQHLADAAKQTALR